MIFWRIALVAAACLAGVLGCATSRAEDAAQTRIYAVGDLHGDFDAFTAILEDAGLINARKRWAGGDAILVQTGDIVDRGPDSLKIINLLQKLEKQAARAGGDVVVLIGNHEAMNFDGDLRYVSDGEYNAFVDAKSRRRRDAHFDSRRDEIAEFYRRTDPDLSDDEIRAKFNEEIPLGWIEHRLAWAGDGDIGEWIISKPAIAKIGRSLFVHGGVSRSYADHSIEEINLAVAADLKDAASATITEDAAGPLWYRGLAQQETEDAAVEEAAHVERVLASFGVDRIVIGHTPSLDGVKSLFGGKVVAIDTGISAAYGGVREYIEITGDEVMVRRAD